MTWNISPKQAIEIQKKLQSQVAIKPFSHPIHTLGGADISHDRFSSVAYAALVVLDFRTLQQIDASFFIGELQFPYIPGLLSFREIPLLLRAWKKLKTKPDLLCLDGQGIAHPRGLGIASHFGVITQSPTLGCAKSRLVGTYQEPKNESKSYSDLIFHGNKIGLVYRTKKNVKPIFVSPGHLIDFASMIRILNSMDYRYRIPEPTRQAHLFSNELRKLGKKIPA